MTGLHKGQYKCVTQEIRTLSPRGATRLGKPFMNGGPVLITSQVAFLPVRELLLLLFFSWLVLIYRRWTVKKNKQTPNPSNRAKLSRRKFPPFKGSVCLLLCLYWEQRLQVFGVTLVMLISHVSLMSWKWSYFHFIMKWQMIEVIDQSLDLVSS